MEEERQESTGMREGLREEKKAEGGEEKEKSWVMDIEEEEIEGIRVRI